MALTKIMRNARISADPNERPMEFRAEDDGPTDLPVESTAWRVLIADDDPDVHASTTLALYNLTIQGRPLRFFHAYSASEARVLLAAEEDVAVVLLDVVMEHELAGLELVPVIRNELGLPDTRIILRTGQPGYAPELDAVRNYDINDYHTKSELTRTKLITTVTSAIRSYAQIRAINASRRGLEFIVRCGSEQIGLHDLNSFSTAVMAQTGDLLRSMNKGHELADLLVGAADEGRNLELIAAHGRFREACNGTKSIADRRATETIRRCVTVGKSVFDDDGAALHLGSRNGRDMVLYFETANPLSDVERELLDVFRCITAAGLDNVSLWSQLYIFAFLDPITGLPNRRRFVTLVEEHLHRVDRAAQIVALVDIDHFGETNDALGRQFGDQLIQAVAARLVVQLGPHVIVGRLAGDVFGLCGEASALGHDRLFDVFSQPFAVEQHRLQVSVSIGLVRLADTEGAPSDAIKDAGIALKHAKCRRRGSYHYFTRAMGTEIVDRVMLLQALRAAVEHQQLALHYQPQVDLATGRAVGAEALLRWQRDGEYIPPLRFVPLAEYSGLIVSLGEWVLRTACLELARLARLGHAGFRLAVNVSVIQFRNPGFLSVLHRVLDETGVNPNNVELEITESVAMDDVEFMVQTLERIKSLGISISVDDFGTGYSSLSQLQRLRVDRLKIDRTFIEEITASERGSSIADMVVNLGRTIGLRVIAEGVENDQQAHVLRQLGCHEAQGFLFARPMPADELLLWLEREQRPAA